MSYSHQEAATVATKEILIKMMDNPHNVKLFFKRG